MIFMIFFHHQLFEGWKKIHFVTQLLSLFNMNPTLTLPCLWAGMDHKSFPLMHCVKWLDGAQIVTNASFSNHTNTKKWAFRKINYYLKSHKFYAAPLLAF